MKTLPSDISHACRHTDIILWDAYERSNGSQPGVFGEGRLVFPRYRDKDDLRVSEQEARFAFVEALCKGPFRYSVETPTSKCYQFTGETSLSAQTDLAVHDACGRCRICNVEFKAKGVSPSAKDNFPIYKDMQKLLREPVWGLWFHLLESTDNSTINKILKVMTEKIRKVQCKFRDVEAPGLTLHLCVLRHGFSLQKDVPFPINDVQLTKDLCICLHVSQSELEKVQDQNGWKLHRKSQD